MPLSRANEPCYSLRCFPDVCFIRLCAVRLVCQSLHVPDIPRSEQALIQALRNGSEEAFRELYNLHYVRLVSIAVKVLDDTDRARGCAQSIIVKLYERHQALEIRTSLVSYLNRAVLNAALTMNKREQGTVFLGVDPDPEATLPVEYRDLMESAEEEERIWQAIEALPPQCKRIFLMSRFEEVSNDEIATKLGISKRTVETQVSLALKKLKNKLLVFWGLMA